MLLGFKSVLEYLPSSSKRSINERHDDLLDIISQGQNWIWILVGLFNGISLLQEYRTAMRYSVRVLYGEVNISNV